MFLMTAALLLFWMRDRALLRMGSPRKVVRHTWVYSLLVCSGVIAVWLLRPTDDTRSHPLTSAPFLIGMAALQITAGIVAFSIKRSERYDLGWLVALIPAPWLWILCSRSVTGWAYWVIASLWLLLMLVDVFRARHMQMLADELDFAVNLAGWSNWVGIGLVALAGTAT